MEKEIYILLKQLLKIDISFIVDDIIGPFADPDIPVNIDEEHFAIDIDTPHGICTLTVIYNDNKNEVLFQRFIGESMYEEYRLELNPKSEFYLCVDGKIVELRKRGFIIINIDKNYTLDEEKNSVVEINRILKKQEVYSYDELKKTDAKKSPFFNLNIKEKKRLLEYLASSNNNLKIFLLNSIFINTAAVSINTSCDYSKKYVTYPYVTINGCDSSSHYAMIPGDNIVRRAYDLYEGVITNENHEDAISLINRGKFNTFFSYEDYNQPLNGGKSINSIIDELIGRGSRNYRQEYSSLVRNIAEQYYQQIKNNPFLFKEYSQASTDQGREFEKNNYIKEILLSNHENM